MRLERAHWSGATSASSPPRSAFRRLTDAEIDRYLEREHALRLRRQRQERGPGHRAALARSRGDDPTALVGLPLIALSAMLRAEGFDVP